MKLNHAILVFLLFFSLKVPAQNKVPEHTLLWEISGKGLQKPSYLLGTYHFAGKNFVDTMKVLNEKLQASTAIVGEVVMNDSLAMTLMPYMLMKNNTLDKLLTPDEYQLVAAHLKQLSGYDLKLFNAMKPAAVQATILQFTAPKTFTKDNPAMDQYFQDYAKANAKQLFGLETVKDQAEILFGSTIERQKELLLKSIKEFEKNKLEGEKLYNNYIAQNLGELEEIFETNKDYTQEEMDQLLKNRNEKWLAQLPKMMQQNSLFIAVGAGHLIGKDGLIKGLQAQGYSVKPIATN